MTPPPAPLLDARRLSVGYGSRAVVSNIDLSIAPGEVVAVLGPNGVGKSTLISTLAGLQPKLEGELWVLGHHGRASVSSVARQGLAVLTERRSVFMSLTVSENLRVGRCSAQETFELFPELRARRHVLAGLLSGGEQQMLALGRALARHPRLLLADELSLGLAPLVIERLLNEVRRAADRGMGVLLVEQNARAAIGVADRVVALSKGEVAFAGSAADARGSFAEIEKRYLGHQPDPTTKHPSHSRGR